MFYSDDPARDYDNYCDYLERENKKWHEENDYYIQSKIEELEMELEDATTEEEKEDLQYEIRKLQEELEK